MRIHNLTGFLCAAKGISLHPPQPSISVVARATYEIADDGSLTLVTDLGDLRPLSGGVYRDDDEERLGGCVVPGELSDFKPRAEVLVTGSCHTPGCKPQTESGVMVALGDWSKGLRVVGEQSRGGQRSPKPFTEMPLDWEHAYGGPGCARNPSGKGYESDALASVMRAADDVAARHADLQPASLGAINPGWPQRHEKLGKDYGGDYLAKRAPHFPADFDWTYFMEAADDQWLPSFPKGDETLLLTNLHPRVPKLAIKLPAVRARAFIRDSKPSFREVPLVLDTIFADMARCRLELSWRGNVEVAEDDLDDVETLVLASEALATPGSKPAQPVAHYQQICEAYEADPTGLGALLPKSNGEGAGDLATGEIPQLGPLLEAQLGELQPAELSTILPLADAAIRKAAAENEKVDKALRETRPSKDEPLPARVSKPGALPYLGLRRHMRGALERASEAKQKALKAGIEPARLGQLTAIEDAARDPRLVEAEPSYTVPEPLSTVAPGPGANLVDRNLIGENLEGADLRGANLEGALLMRANLRGAKLAGARLYGATLVGADLSDADLFGADLTRVNASSLTALRARFDEATLDLAFFEEAKLDSASFDNAKGEYAIFTRASLRDASMKGATLPNAELDDAELQGATLIGVRIFKGRFNGSRLQNADLSRAELERACFQDARLSQARFFDATLNGAILNGAIADRCIFAFARLRNCHMDKVDLGAADFYGADLREVRLLRAQCGATRFVSSNLFGADLSKATLTGTKFNAANLYDAKLGQAKISACDFSFANLKRTVLEKR